jgi:hypothetical protein
LLGAALGLSSEAVNILVDGRDHAREHQYGAHLAARMKDAGIPATWLDQPNAKISPEYLSALRKFASASTNKAPIRRANFRRIAAAFEGREQVLADALEMIASAIPNIVDGLLEMDDGRIGHMNPRLMRAGFPDNWLEQAEPDLPDALLLALEQLATDEYERHFEAADEKTAHEGQAFVAAPPEPSPTMQPTAAPVDKPKETVMAPKSQANPPSLPPQQPEFKAGGMPGAAKPMAHPSAGAPRLPRSVMAAGRSISGPAAKPIGSAPAKSVSRGTPPPQMPQLPAGTSAGAAPAHTPTVAAAPSNPPTKQDTAPVAKQTTSPAPRGTVSKEVSMARANALEQLLTTARRGAKVTLWRDLVGSSLPFWGNIRRGAVLFRDDLAKAVETALELPEGWLDKPSFPPATIAAWLTDESAPVPEFKSQAQGDSAQDQVGDAGQGAATDTAQQAAADTSTQGAPAGSTKGSGAKRDMSKPFAASKAPQAPRVTMAGTPGANPPVLPGAAADSGATADGGAGADASSEEEDRQLKLVDMGSPAPGAMAPAPQASGTPAAQASAAANMAQAPVAPVVAPAPAPAATSSVGPFAAAGALLTAGQREPGPLTQALLSIITAKAAAGTFAETDALALINKLMAP